MTDETERNAAWDAELEGRGVAAVAAFLAGDGVGAGRNAEFRLFIPDSVTNPTRGCIEDWLGRKEATVAARETFRFHCIFSPALIAAIAGVIAAWPVVRSWW